MSIEPSRPPKIDEMMDISSLSGLTSDEALSRLGYFIDCSADEGRTDAIRHALILAENMPALIDPMERAALNYCRARAWSALHYESGDAQDWSFDHESMSREIFYLRCALREHPQRPSSLQCQILTNLGNALNHVGRCVEALGYWERVLTQNPSFGMALGNRGIGRYHYAGSLYDDGHQRVLIVAAHRDLKEAQQHRLEGDAANGFNSVQKDIEARCSPDFLTGLKPFKAYPLGRSDEEIRYREWCLRERLFLNPLNDWAEHSIAARDVLTTPSILVRAGEGPTFQGFYNQLKQEFVSARFMLYEGIHCRAQHYSDSDALLWDTLDAPVYSLSIEKLRCAYRVFYGLFDKVAFFLNSYLELNIAEKDVSFRKLWHIDGKQKKGLKPAFQRRPNWPLRGLYWLSKDIFETNQEAAMEPAAQALNEIRNHLEHKYLKISDDSHVPQVTGLRDALAHTVPRRDFEQKSLHLAKLARATLIYLSLALHREEVVRTAKVDRSTILALDLPLIEDGAKC